RLATAGSSCSRAARTATSCASSSRSSSRTPISTRVCGSWRTRLQTQAQELASSTPAAAAADVTLQSIRKTYGEVVAVDRVDLEIARGEFFTMLGPSGSGKTTTLRVIAGFERPDEGRVLLRGVDVTERPPYARDVNTVFQDYALFPHMTVAANVGYGLKVKGVPRRPRHLRAREALER